VQAVTDTVYVADVLDYEYAGGSCDSPDFTTNLTDDADTIQAAIDAVDASPSLTTVYLCAGTYNITATLHASAELTIQGANAATTILDGGAELNVDGSWLRNGVRILYGEDGLTVSNLTFTHGHSAEGSGAIGGSGPMHIADAEFTYNSGAYGGAISNGGSVEVIRSTFIENYASNNGGAITASEIVAISSSIFSGNSAFSGGAVHSNVSVTSIQSSFTDNEASYGGAIATNDIIVNRSTFTRNSATQGGAIYSFGPTATVTNCEFTGNEAIDDGGAMYLVTAGASSVTSSTFASNLAWTGGAVNFVPATGSEVLVSRNLFTKNEANVGGATDQDSDGLLNFRRNTFTSNQAIGEDAQGGAVWVFNAKFSGNRFSRNRSDLHGGAIYSWTRSVARAAMRSDFIGNRAPKGRDVYYTR
jgi:predicted outer membrane repeat protein